MNRRLLLPVLLLGLALLASSCIGPPFLGTASVGPTYDPTPGGYHQYPAIDFALPHGHPILAVEAGFVRIADEETWDDESAWPRRPGRFVVLDHRGLADNVGYSPPPCTRYSHLDEFAPNVAPGRWVKRGQVIGYAGNTQTAGDVHLHFDAPACDLFTDWGPTGGFNAADFSTQTDYGLMEWCDPRSGWKLGGSDSFRPGQLVYFGPCE